MIIKIDPSGAPRLDEADNFRSFKIVLPAGLGDPRQALSVIGRQDDGHVWVSRCWIEENGRPADADWATGFEAMITYAQSAGWVDEDGAIRAHVETV